MTIRNFDVWMCAYDAAWFSSTSNFVLSLLLLLHSPLFFRAKICGWQIPLGSRTHAPSETHTRLTSHCRAGNGKKRFHMQKIRTYHTELCKKLRKSICASVYTKKKQSTKRTNERIPAIYCNQKLMLSTLRIYFCLAPLRVDLLYFFCLFIFVCFLSFVPSFYLFIFTAPMRILYKPGAPHTLTATRAILCHIPGIYLHVFKYSFP